MSRNTRPGRANHSEPGWHPEEIKAAIRMRGTTMSELSRRHGYSNGAVKEVLRRPWPAVEKLVADFLGVLPQTIWPGRYGPDGKSNRLLFGKYKPRGKHARRQCKKSQAA